MHPQMKNKHSATHLDQRALAGVVDIDGRSSLVSRNVTIGSHRTSVRLEPDMWTALREICRREHVTIHDIATVVSVRKAQNTSLTAALRVFVMAYYRMAATEEGHNNAGHGLVVLLWVR